MRDQQKIYIQTSSCIRNSDILNVNMSSDICSFIPPKFNISGATKINEEKLECNFSGVSYNDMVLSSITDCSFTDINCLETLSWDLEINENNEVVYSGNVTTDNVTGNTLSQTQVNNAVILGFNTLGYNYTYTGSSFSIQKPYGVEDLSVYLCLDINISDRCFTDYCDKDFELNPVGDGCVYTISTTPTRTVTGNTVTSGYTTEVYGSYGTRFYEDITNKEYPIVSTGGTATINYSNGDIVNYSGTILSEFWGSGFTVGNFYGRLNDVGIAGGIDTEWKGFSQCFNFNEDTTYYIGLAADNFCRFYINKELIINFDIYNDNNHKLWYIFPYTFISGKNIIEMEGKNDTGVHSFGFELYSASTLSELTGATNTTEAKAFWDTSYGIGGYYDLGETFGYQCPSGYSLDVCSEVISCTKIIHEPLISPYTGECSVLCAVLCDNTYQVINSGDTGVYIIDTGTTITLEFEFTGDTISFTGNNITFNYEIYKYNSNTNTFSNSPIYKSDSIEYSTFSGTNILSQTILINDLGIDGEYVVKGYYVFNYCTEFFDYLNIKNTSLDKNNKTYGLYDNVVDFYFIINRLADKPSFTYQIENSLTPNGLLGYTIFPQYSGQSEFLINRQFVGSIIVSVNGVTLTNDEYQFISSASTLTIAEGLDISDVLVINGVTYNNTTIKGLTSEYININTPILSGITGGQSGNVYYNTSEGKYEVYITSEPNDESNVILTLNGLTMAQNVDYYLSITDPHRIILNGEIYLNDIINVIYTSKSEYVGDIYTNTPIISWFINNAPDNNNGSFTVELTDESDVNFNSIIYTASTPYIQSQKYYSVQIIVNGDIGINYIYRVKNEKKYTTVVGDDISTVNYSEVIPIQIQSNSINSY